MAFLDEKETEKMLKELIGKLPFRKHGLYCFCNSCMNERISLGIQADKDLIAKLKNENEMLKNCKADCSKCLNKGVTNSLSQESFCDGCLWQGNAWKSDNYKL